MVNNIPCSFDQQIRMFLEKYWVTGCTYSKTLYNFIWITIYTYVYYEFSKFARYCSFLFIVLNS